jgi:hypothetical protein
MITFRPMTLLVAASFRRIAVLATGLLACAGVRTGAQVQLTHTEDASPVPVGMLRLRVATGWTRYDQRFGTDGLTALGEELSADPLGTRQLPLLGPLETAVQSLAVSPGTRLSLGRLVTRGDARIATTPIALELGVTRRLSLGVVVPVVQTRRTITLDVNSTTGAPANVGLVPGAERGNAAAANSAAAASFSSAAQQLSALIARCTAAPSGAGCGAVAADPAGAAAATARAQQFAAAATALGSTATTVSLAPRAMGTLAVQIELQRIALNQQLDRFLGAGAARTSPVYFARTDFSYIDLQGRDGTPGLLQSALGGGLDSIRTTERIGIGDISVGAQYMVFDGFQRDSLPVRGRQARLAVGGAFRFGTGRADTASSLVDIGTGEGDAVELRSALDVIQGRLGGTIAARYVRTFARTVHGSVLGDPESGFPVPVFGNRVRSASDVIALDLTPRYLLSESFALDGHYGLERTGTATYAPVSAVAADVVQPAYCGTLVVCTIPAGRGRLAQRIGLGLRYSTVDGYARGTTRFPVEVTYTHLTTISGDPGVPKLSREQVQLRLFYRLFGK